MEEGISGPNNLHEEIWEVEVSNDLFQEIIDYLIAHIDSFDIVYNNLNLVRKGKIENAMMFCDQQKRPLNFLS